MGEIADPPKQFVEIANLLKDLKLPSFGGEGKKQNKDAISIFIYKWASIHSVSRSFEDVGLVEASLSLMGKAYKWWKYVRERLRTWGEFETNFRK